MYTLRKHLMDTHVYKTKPLKDRFYLKMLMFGTAAAFVGYSDGKNNSDQEDKTKYTIEFEGYEEQIYDILKRRKPLVTLYYTSGATYYLQLRPHFLRFAKDYQNEYEYMLINCSNHYKYCRNEDISKFPTVKVFYPEGIIPIDKKYRMEGLYATAESQYDYNYDGLYGFLVYKGPQLKEIEEIIKTV